MLRRLLLIGVCVLFMSSPLIPAKVNAEDVQQSVVISEIQTTGIDAIGADDGKKEFIEIQAAGENDIDLTGWRVQYFAATRTDVFIASAEPTRDIAVLDGWVEANGYILLSYIDYLQDADMYFGQGSAATSGLMAKSGGHLRILSSENVVMDIVGWGTAVSPETKALPVLDAGESASRMVDAETGSLNDTGNNYSDFQITDTPTPTGGSLFISDIPGETEQAPPACDGIIISEILPNPNGTDTGQEFIELYNPTDETVPLEDCELSITSGKKIYTFGIGSSLEPKQYLTLSDQITGLVLPNASGAEVLLTGTNTEYAVQYPPALVANHSWAMFASGWLETDRPTPDSDNLPSVPVVVEVEDIEELAPCPAGKVRNPDTNRCRNIQETATAMAPCSAGQIRNPETNRCRSLGSVVSALIPCRENQERNPETNRCRNVLGTVTSEECKEGYERNPETNRCRKTPVVKVSNSAADIKDNSMKRQLSSPFILIASVVVVGYGLYEYRRDLTNAVYRIRKRFTGSNTVE